MVVVNFLSIFHSGARRQFADKVGSERGEQYTGKVVSDSRQWVILLFVISAEV
jgi:hypothetical protein